MTQVKSNPAALDRRTIVKGGAWAVPVIAVAATAPLAAASDPRPDANYGLSGSPTNPKVGTNPTLRILGAHLTEDGGYEAPAKIPVGTEVSVHYVGTFDSFTHSPCVEPLVSSVSEDQSEGAMWFTVIMECDDVWVRFFGVGPVGARFTISALGGSSTSTVSAA